MNFWLFLWVVLAVFVLGIFFWSLQVLMKQKMAWQKFAKKFGLGFDKGSFLQSPVISGSYEEFNITLFSEEQPASDIRRRQFRTLLLIRFHASCEPVAVIGTSRHGAFLKDMNLPEKHTPSASQWDDKLAYHTHDEKGLKAYLSPERNAAFHKLLHIKNADMLFVMDNQDGYFTLETPDPFDNADALNKRVENILKELRVIIGKQKPVGTGEKESGKPAPKKKPAKKPASKK